MLAERAFGDAGARVVIEERLTGREVSMMALCDGDAPGAAGVVRGPQGGRRRRRRAEHRRHGDGLAVAAGRRRGSRSGSCETLFVPTVRALAAAGRPFRGLLYGGLMLTPDRGPMVIEWNCRFGDPETQSVLMRLDGRSAALAGGRRRAARCRRARRVRARAWRVCVVLAAGGYPGKPRAGDAITGLPAGQPTIWSCSTPARAATPAGRWSPPGGRVLGVTAYGADLAAARARAYGAIEGIRFDGMHFRRDIGLRGKTEHERQRDIDVAIMMGSKSDLETMRPAAKVLEKLGLAVEVRVLSAHRTPEEAAAFVKDAGPARRQGVHLRRGRRGAPGGRGRGAHDAPGDRRADRRRAAWAGFDSLLSTVQMPPGMPVATVAIGGAENAGLLAAQIIAVADPALAARVEAERAARRKKVLDSDAEVRAQSERGLTAATGQQPMAHAFDEEIVFAVAALRRGEIVAYPTETFYGLGVDALDELALARLRAAQGARTKRRSRCWSTGRRCWTALCRERAAAGARR